MQPHHAIHVLQRHYVHKPPHSSFGANTSHAIHPAAICVLRQASPIHVGHVNAHSLHTSTQHSQISISVPHTVRPILKLLPH